MTQAITPLRQRMIDDMRLRKLSPKTQSAYLLHVRRLAAFLHRSGKQICQSCDGKFVNSIKSSLKNPLLLLNSMT